MCLWISVEIQVDFEVICSPLPPPKKTQSFFSHVHKCTLSKQERRKTSLKWQSSQLFNTHTHTFQLQFFHETLKGQQGWAWAQACHVTCMNAFYTPTVALTASIIDPRTAGSARVVMSPKLAVLRSPSAIFRRMRRMIFPERVLGRPSTTTTISGVAHAPITTRTCSSTQNNVTTLIIYAHTKNAHQK